MLAAVAMLLGVAATWAGAAPPGTAPAGGGVAGKATVAPAAPVFAPAPAAADRRQENKALVRRYLTEVLAAGRLDRLDEIVAKGFVDRSANAPNLRGAELVRQTRQKLQSLFSKLVYEPQDLVAEGDRVVARYLVLATPRPEPGRPVPQPLVLTGVAFFRVRDGKLQEAFVLNDQLGMLRQLGYKFVPPGVATGPASVPGAGGGGAAASPGAPPAGAADTPPAASPPPPPPAILHRDGLGPGR